MRKYLALLVALCGLLIPVAALAADWDGSVKNMDLVAEGAACEDGDDGAWYHFVNNQTGGATTKGTLSATFSDSSENDSVEALAVNQNVQHFYIFGESTILTATTDLQGKLVLSHIVCGKKTDTPWLDED